MPDSKVGPAKAGPDLYRRYAGFCEQQPEMHDRSK